MPCSARGTPMLRASASLLVLAGVASAGIVGPDSWYYGCALEDTEKRGHIAAELDQKKFARHIGYCVTYCDPPSGGCTVEMASTSCDCLKCMMACLKSGSYVTECINPHTVEKCDALSKTIGTDTNICDVDCNGATRWPWTSGLVVAVLASLWR
mmetsp:Transcript_110803/g.247285  ORF Transcript_110803/g.247285 Transcript_110803/m.247285 type:complete len:154 (+) Transcript_110803:62-523(+)